MLNFNHEFQIKFDLIVNNLRNLYCYTFRNYVRDGRIEKITFFDIINIYIKIICLQMLTKGNLGGTKKFRNKQVFLHFYFYFKYLKN